MNVSKSSFTLESEQAATSSLLTSGDEIHDPQVSTNDFEAVKIDVNLSAVTLESEQAATSSSQTSGDEICDLDILNFDEDMSTSSAVILMKAIKEDDFITISRLLKGHCEKLKRQKCSNDFFTPPILQNDYWEMEALLVNDKLTNAFFREPPKNEIWNLLLHISCLRGNEKLTELLLAKGASATSKLGNVNTALHTAVWENHLKIVHLLLQTDPACVNIKGKFGRTALHLAVIEARTTIVDLLLQYGADVKLGDRCGRTVLHDACWRGNEYMVEYLLKHSRSTINSRDNGGFTALHLATVKGNVNIVKLLLNSNEIADIYDQHKAHLYKTFTDQETIDWTKKGNLIKHLIVHRKQGDLCVTALNILACYTCSQEIELLTTTAADVNLTDKIEQTALDYANEENMFQIIQVLLKHGAFCNEPPERRTEGVYRRRSYVPKQIMESLLTYSDYNNITHVFDCVRNVFLIDEVDIEFLQCFMKYIMNYTLRKHVYDIDRIFNSDLKLARQFLCSGIRIKYLNDKYVDIRLPAKIYYFVRYCVACNEGTIIEIVKIEADDKYVMNFCHRPTSTFYENNRWLSTRFNGKTQMEFLDDCVKETEVMKRRRLGDTAFSLFDLIEMDLNELAKYLRSNALLYALERESNFSEFPICGEILQMHIDRGLKRRLLLDKCIQYFPSAYSGCPTLPLEIIQVIFNKLNNRDLYAFSYAFCSIT